MKDTTRKNKRQSHNGEKHGRLLILSDADDRASSGGRKRRMVLCLCGCGKKHITALARVLCGGAVSCGCRHRHGEANTPENKAWNSLRQRCTNKNNPRHYLYGARGISCCKRWDEYMNFLEDMGRRPSPKHSIDRIDNDGDYCPENCRWATTKEQGNNRRTNRNITINGETLNVSQWCERLGISRYKACLLLKAGMSSEDALGIRQSNVKKKSH